MVNILVTEPSPDVPPASSISSLQVEPPSTLVHVLEQRESEDYQTDLEDSNSNSPDKGMSCLLHSFHIPFIVCFWFRFCSAFCASRFFIEMYSNIFEF